MGGGGNGGGNEAAAGTSLRSSGAHQAEQSSGGARSANSRAVIQQLVNRVFAGVTPEGLSQFTIEFKSDVLERRATRRRRQRRQNRLHVSYGR